MDADNSTVMAANSENAVDSHRMKLRPRRSALSDISNSIAQQFSNITKKVITRKRKQSDGVETEHIVESDVSTTVQESSSSSPAPSASSQEQHQMQDLVEMVNNPSFGARLETVPLTQEEKDSKFYGYRVPPRIKRRVPLLTRCADPCQCLDILDDMYAIYNDMQEKYHPRSFISPDIDLALKMRSILVDWIIEVHCKYKLQPPTLWLTINILDRYLVQVSLPRQRVQLAGITAFFIACKFEEINPPEVRDCVYLTDNAYTRQDVLDMETSILTVLDYQLLVPTGYHFLVRLLNRIGATDRLRHIANFTAERSLQEPEIFSVGFKVYAAAAVLVALRMVHEDEGPDFKVWSPALEEESGLKEEELLVCARNMVKRNMEGPLPPTQPSGQTNRRRLEAVKNKYGTKNMQYISSLNYHNLF